MEWIMWTIDNLPDPGQRVLIAYRSGLVGAIEFFYNEQAKLSYINGVKWHQENPNAYMGGKLANTLKDLDNSDPIIAWMPCPIAPNQVKDGMDNR